MVDNWAIRPAAVWLFGSAARGTGTPESDVDLVVVRPDGVNDEDPAWEAQLGDLSRSVQAWSGNHCELIEYTSDELGRLAASGDELVHELRRDALVIVGQRPSALLLVDH